MRFDNNTGANLKRYMLSVLILVFAAGFLFALGEPPTLLSEPVFTGGTTNTLHWTMPSSAVPTAFQVLVDTASTGEPLFAGDSCYGGNPISICPIPLSRTVGDSFTVGTAMTGSLADVALVSGVRYCYKIRYRYAGDSWSSFSDIVCSTQDAIPPVISVTSMPNWTNVTETAINFTTADSICRWVSSVKLYFRADSSSAWNFSGSTSMPSGSGAGNVNFNSASHGGDGYYEFYLSGGDSLGNERIPLAAIHNAHTWTRFDTGRPVSSITTGTHDRYYTTRNLKLITQLAIHTAVLILLN
jgi:hypothetical protein